MKNNERASQIFAMNPDREKVHMTSDGQGFFDEHLAQNHQRSLGGDGKLETINFEDTAYGQAVIAKQGKKSGKVVTLDNGDQGGAGDDTGAKALKDMGFEELKDVAKAEEVNVEGLRSKKDVRAAIEAKRAELTQAAKETETKTDEGDQGGTGEAGDQGETGDQGTEDQGGDE